MYCFKFRHEYNSIIMATDYKVIFKQVKADIAAKRQELGEAMQNVDGLEAEIAGLQQTAAGLARMLGVEFIAEDELGLTDAIRGVFKTNYQTNFTALEVRDALQTMGYDITKYGNVMASIHSVIKRLLDQGSVLPMGIRGSNDKPTFKWKLTASDIASKAPKPATPVRR